MCCFENNNLGTISTNIDGMTLSNAIMTFKIVNPLVCGSTTISTDPAAVNSPAMIQPAKRYLYTFIRLVSILFIGVLVC